MAFLLVGCSLLFCTCWLLQKRGLWEKRMKMEWGHPGHLMRDATGGLVWVDPESGEPIKRYKDLPARVMPGKEAVSPTGEMPALPEDMGGGLGFLGGLAALSDDRSSAGEPLSPRSPRSPKAGGDSTRSYRMSVAGGGATLQIDRISCAMSDPEPTDEELSMESMEFMSFAPAQGKTGLMDKRGPPSPRGGRHAAIMEEDEEMELPKTGHPSRLNRAKAANQKRATLAGGKADGTNEQPSYM